MPASAIQQYAGADHVRVNEITGIIDAAVDVRFGGKIDHGIKLVLGEQRVHLIGIRDVRFEKLVAVPVFLDHAIKVRQVTGVSQNIDIGDQRRFIMLKDISDEVAAD